MQTEIAGELISRETTLAYFQKLVKVFTCNKGKPLLASY